MSKDVKQKKESFETLLHEYLESNPVVKRDGKTNELEVRFGINTKQAPPLSKINYDNVIKQLYSSGFKSTNIDGIQLLRIQSEYFDAKIGKTKTSNIRAEIVGSHMIQEYCKSNSLQTLINMASTTFNKIKFTQKASAIAKDGSVIRKFDMEDFNFRVAYQTEQDYNIQSPLAKNIISKWTDSKKLFRNMNRVRLYHDEFPIFADLSIVKMSKKIKHVPIPEYNIQDAGVFSNPEQYEIELEIDNNRVGPGTEFNTVPKLMAAIKQCIRIVLSGLQGTKYPVSYNECATVLQHYMVLVHGPSHDPTKRIRPSNFIGPGSMTLQIENIVPMDEGSTVPNIRNHYTVTDKADGERKLLYISDQGRVYLIDTNMNVIFTGTKTGEKTIYNSLLDGEHIKTDKQGNIINLYAAFDIYYVNGVSTREFIFYKEEEEVELGEEEEKKEKKPIKTRLPLLRRLIDIMQPETVLEIDESGKKPVTDFSVRCKAFEISSDKTTIFEASSAILSRWKDGLFEYNTDGLIFTPANMAVGASRPGGPAGPLFKSTWEDSFKWKPPEFNTIDFLVSIKKDKTGKDEVHHIFEEGRNLQNMQEVRQYKTIVLRCGFDERKHGYINPFQDILNDNLPAPKDIDNEDTYKPVPFQPTNPFDPTACFCNIELKEDGSKLFMTTEEGEYFEEHMIVEFKYDSQRADGWKWIPLRVRYDKTAELRANQKNYGNAYHVANNNWHSIHHPITEEMITTGQNIPEVEMSEDVYYKRSNEETSTRGLRDFHNLFVKRSLILGVAHRGDTLIDFAVGKAGDLSKWIYAKLRFVFGIDISRDNIYNQLDGACARFLNSRKKYNENDMPRALFITGNSSLNLRSGIACFTEKDKQITSAVFGEGPKDATLLGKGGYRQYGVGQSGFTISSCQFALHYFFENRMTFYNFIRNISECTKVDGYFIGTCYDGRTVFDTLQQQQNGESISIFKGERKIYELTKRYDQTGFPDDDLSLGYAVDVYQESINQTFREFLVNFTYFTRIMEDYGFVIVDKDVANRMKLPNGTGMFSDLFTFMENELRRNPNKRADYGTAYLMSSEEKRISFMNRYFVFQKRRHVDAKKLTQIALKSSELFLEVEEEKPVKPTGAKLVLRKKTENEKVVLRQFEQPAEESVPVPALGEAKPKLKLKIKVPAPAK